jgi:leukotriene-A4 hydrolase
MRPKEILFVFFTPLFVLFINACGDDSSKKAASPTVLMADSSYDNHSYSNINEVRSKHLDLELDVNFKNQTIYGVARHTLENLGSDTVVFDIKHLEIQKITLGKGKEIETNFLIGEWDKDSLLGQPLLVKIEPNTKYVNIYYETTQKTEAIDWLPAELTDGKSHPYMYTQGQAILTRSWIPLQDSPANRLTYSAEVKVPKELMAVMSAKNEKQKNPEGKYKFTMDKPVPSYLIALAVGDLDYKALGKNCGVYTEPVNLKKAANEFSELPKMIDAAEQLYGPYQWGQYDLLVLPNSFPFGGMENPCLTFVSPTVIAGDKSLTSVIAHELAHSWSGNLVTNASWEDFWLNEGFTVYFENRIMEALYGKEIADMLLLIEFEELQDEIETIAKGEHPDDSKLKLNLAGRNPDDGMTSIAYVKGAFFLKTLESQVGREKFDVFLKAYFTNNAFRNMSTERFVDYLNIHLLDIHKITFNTDEWIFKKGLPKNCIAINSPRFAAMEQLVKRFKSNEDIFEPVVKYVKVKGKKRKKKEVLQLKKSDFIAQEWLEFLRKLPDSVSVDRLKYLDRYVGFTNWNNAEIKTEWFTLAIRSGYNEAYPQIENFLKKTGRRKYLLPIYEELSRTSENLKWTKTFYTKAKDNYHFVSKQSIEEILNAN